MRLRAEFVALALRMQEMADGITVEEKGARNSKMDMSTIQAIHDYASMLGANCSMAEARSERAPEGLIVSGSTGNGLPHGAQGSGSQATGLYNGALRTSSGVLESAGIRETGLQLIESALTLEPIILREAKADYQIKLIAPGAGASAYYPPAVLKRDGPNVFKEGTQVFLNHQTAAEAAARPEGDVRNLAGVLTTAASYEEDHAKGPGLYARMKVFADHARLVEEKAAHVGMSIRALGTRSGETKDGLPVVGELIAAKSVDVVTQAGAGGMILTEVARAAKEQEMDEAAVQKLIEAAVKAAQAPLIARAIRGDAREEASRVLTGISLQEASKARVIDRILSRDLPMVDEQLDKAKFSEALTAEAKAEGAYVASLTGAGRVIGMGSSGAAPDAASTVTLKEASLAMHKRALNVFSEFGVPPDAAKAIASKYGEAA